MTKRYIVLSVIMALAIGGVQASTVNFNSLSQPGSTVIGVGTSVDQDGFNFSGLGNLLAVWGSGSINSPGQTSLFSYWAGATVKITAIGGNAFTLNSIDLAPLLSGGTGIFEVKIIGTHTDNSTVSASFNVNDSLGLQKFSFSDFTDLTSVSLVQGYNNGEYGSQATAFQFTNVVVNESYPSSVPEPASLVLVGLGLAVLGLSRRRKN
jgi:hypothetical protein